MMINRVKGSLNLSYSFKNSSILEMLKITDSRICRVLLESSSGELKTIPIVDLTIAKQSRHIHLCGNARYPHEVRGRTRMRQKERNDQARRKVPNATEVGRAEDSSSKRAAVSARLGTPRRARARALSLSLSLELANDCCSFCTSRGMTTLSCRLRNVWP